MQIVKKYTLLGGMLSLAVLLAATAWPSQPQTRELFLTWGEANNGLQVAVAFMGDSEGGSSPQFIVGFQNVSGQDMVIDLGKTAADEVKYFPDKIYFRLSRPDGLVQYLEYRVPEKLKKGSHDYQIPLTVGSKYIIRLRLEDYFDSLTQKFQGKLNSGTYRISAIYKNTQDISRKENGAKLSGSWNGEVSSAELEFIILEKK